MKTHFDISIPSIPGKMIKFKIQDIKTTAFGSQKNRFNENKQFLTKKFIQSFNNFHEKQPQGCEDGVETEADSRITKQSKREPQYRFLIPEEKKYLLHEYDKYRNYRMPILKETKFNRGFSFYKSNDANKSEMPSDIVDRSCSVENNNLTDNYYFQPNKNKPEEGKEQKHLLPTCVFKNETRKRVYSKFDKPKQAIPGPGAYFKVDSNSKPKKKKDKNIESKTDIEFDYKNLRQIITNIVVSQSDAQPEVKVKQEDKAGPKMDHMFIVDDRDRFGNQKYPIAHRVNVPGPGAYENNISIEQKVKRVLIVEQQRKLLKDWFNN